MIKSKVLHQAKLEYLMKTDINRTQPFYGAGFYLVGDSGSIDFGNDMRLYWIVGGRSCIDNVYSFFVVSKKAKVI